MGTDIHMYVEVRKDGQWESADKWEESKYSEGRMTINWGDHLYDDRNYHLFAILADVRNGQGVAGLDTGDRFNPISPPKGLPIDVTGLVSKDIWDHTFSWLTFTELMEYDWTQVNTLRGIVHMKEYYQWNLWYRKQGYGPDNYCAGISGPGIQIIEEEEADKILEAIREDYKHREDIINTIKELYDRTYVKTAWTVTYAQAVGGSWWIKAFAPLMKLANEYGPDNVRIVFGFDS